MLMLIPVTVSVKAMENDGVIRCDILSSGACGEVDAQYGGVYEYNSLEIGVGDTLTIGKKCRVTVVNNETGITKCTMEKDSTLIIYGDLSITALSADIRRKIIFKDGGSLNLDVYSIDFNSVDRNLVIEGNGGLAIKVNENYMTKIENMFCNIPHTTKDNILIVKNSYAGSVISQGNI